VKQNSVRQRRKSRNQNVGFLLIALTLCTAAGLFGLSKWIEHTHPSLDQTTLCPAVGPDGLTVVLIDASDPLNVVQRQDLRNRLQELKDTLGDHFAIDLYALRPFANELLQPEGGRVCNPGSGDHASVLTSNPRLIKERWKSRFSEPLDDIFDRMLQDHTASKSPILESIQSIAVSEFGHIPDRIAARKLVIISDMLQNTDEFSQYRHLTPFSELRQTAYYRRIRADLHGVEVEIYYIQRSADMQGKQHIQFWQEYFADSGARLTRVVAVQG
jgi:hypothetical protein